jgi:hypothetical protein
MRQRGYRCLERSAHCLDQFRRECCIRKILHRRPSRRASSLAALTREKMGSSDREAKACSGAGSVVFLYPCNCQNARQAGSHRGSVQRDESGRSDDRRQDRGNDQAAGPEQERQARRDDHRQVCPRSFARAERTAVIRAVPTICPRKPRRPLPKRSSPSQKFDRRQQRCGLAHGVRRSPTIKPFPSAPRTGTYRAFARSPRRLNRHRSE